MCQEKCTLLVHEVYLRLFGREQVDWQDRAHFFAFAARQMRHVLVDHARERNALKRGSGVRISLDEARAGAVPFEHDVEGVHDVLKRLESRDPDAGKVVELKFFGGLTDREVAEVLGVSLSTVRRTWEFARAWIATQLGAAQS